MDRASVNWTITPIGTILTGYGDRASTPIQTALNPKDQGRVVLHDEFVDGLDELDGFDFAWLLTWLASEGESVTQPASMRQVPFLLSAQQRRLGLFAMRGPRRPNSIGLHLVQVLEVDSHGFTFAGVDMLANTPLLDIKPYVSQLDQPTAFDIAHPIRNGWFDDADLSAAHTPESLVGKQRHR